jgi:rfaE bifunctional protein kinase chain/domain
MYHLEKQRASDIIKGCGNKTVAVIGDVMLDRFFWGKVTRISPEAPVPVIDLEDESYHLGGAANVANNLKSLGTNVLLCGSVGKDYAGSQFIDIAKQNLLKTEGLYVCPERPTTVKTRIIGNNQHIARLDKESRDYITPEAENYIIDTIFSCSALDCIIFEDYNKGTITPELIRKVISYAGEKKIPVLVDPKFFNFFEYKGVTVFKPNLKELTRALGIEVKTKENIVEAGKNVLQTLQSEYLLLTLGPDGMILFGKDGSLNSIQTTVRQVADVSGAGDTVIATLASCLAGGANMLEAATMANYAAGVVCEQPGVVSIEIDKLLRAVESNTVRFTPNVLG